LLDSAAAEGTDLERALIDVRIGKYFAIANLEVVKAADAMSKTLEGIVR
jgi:hypothetical protein